MKAFTTFLLAQKIFSYYTYIIVLSVIYYSIFNTAYNDISEIDCYL